MRAWFYVLLPVALTAWVVANPEKLIRLTAWFGEFFD
jgi:hypothetical protein